MDDQDRLQLRAACSLVIAARNMIGGLWANETDRLEYAKVNGLDETDIWASVNELENNIADLETVIDSLEALAPDED